MTDTILDSSETGGLFRIAIRLMEATSSQPDKGCAGLVTRSELMLTYLARSAYVPLVNLIGILFQIADDYLNLQSDAVSQSFRCCILSSERADMRSSTSRTKVSVRI